MYDLPALRCLAPQARAAVVALAEEQTPQEAARRSGLSEFVVVDLQRLPGFQTALQEARAARAWWLGIEADGATATLLQGSLAAVETVCEIAHGRFPCKTKRIGGRIVHEVDVKATRLQLTAALAILDAAGITSGPPARVRRRRDQARDLSAFIVSPEHEATLDEAQRILKVAEPGKRVPVRTVSARPRDQESDA